MNFKQAQIEKIEFINQVLKNSLPNDCELQKTIVEAMEYNLLAGGKKIRPMIMFESYQMFGGNGREIECFLAAMEMIHTYSLVHDDLPAMDNDDYRRGRKTTHIVYGEDMAILTGDALLNFAFETATKAFDIAPENSKNIGKALQIMSRKAGIYGMIGGQVVDVQSTGAVIDEITLDFIFRLKTSALIECAMMVGATLAGASEENIADMEEIARNVGIAFQIQDDILDITSSTEMLGKPVLSDEKNKKTTYVTLKGLEQARMDVEKYSNKAITVLQKQNGKSEYLEWLVNQLIYREN